MKNYLKDVKENYQILVVIIFFFFIKSGHSIEKWKNSLRIGLLLISAHFHFLKHP